MNKQTAVEWLISELRDDIIGVVSDVKLHVMIETALAMEREQQEDVLEWRESMFTKDAPIEYILREFNKLKNK